MIQVACQSCERSSQAHVDVGLMYIVERETKTAQPKWNAGIVLGLAEGPLSHWTHCAKFLFPPEGSTFTLFAQLILEAAFGRPALWLWLLRSHFNPRPKQVALVCVCV